MELHIPLPGSPRAPTPLCWFSGAAAASSASRQRWPAQRVLGVIHYANP